MGQLFFFVGGFTRKASKQEGFKTLFVFVQCCNLQPNRES